MTKQKTVLTVKNIDISIVPHDNADFICLSDMTKGFTYSPR